MRARLLPCAIAIAIAPTLAFADDYDEFRVPDHSTTDWSVALRASANRTASNFPSNWDRRAGGGGGLSASFSHWLDGDRRSFRWSTELSQHASMTSESRGRLTILPAMTEMARDHSWSRRLAEDWAISATERRWLWRGPIALSASLSARGEYEQSKGNVELFQSLTDTLLQQDVVRDIESRQFSNMHRVSGSAGVGVGRVRDLTAVHMAHLIEARLRESGALTRPLSPGARARLAELIVSTDALRRAEDRPAAVVWRAIEELLRQDGALAGEHLDGPTTLRAGEPFRGSERFGFAGLPVMPIVRMRGEWIGVVLGGEHQRRIWRSNRHLHDATYLDGALFSEWWSNGSERHVGSSDFATTGLEGEWYRPFGDRWQVAARGGYRTALRKETPLRSGSESITLDWLVAERWVLFVGADHERVIRDIGVSRKVGYSGWRFGLRGRASWYLRNRLWLDFSFTDAQYRDREWVESGVPEPGSYHRYGSASLSLNYRLRTGIHAPGFPALEAAGARTPQL